MKKLDKPILMEVSRIFTTLDYHYENSFNHVEFFQCAIKTLNRCIAIQDCVEVLKLILQFETLYRRFCELMQDETCRQFFDKLKLSPLLMNLFDTPNHHKYCITNAITPDFTRYFVTSSDFDGQHFEYVNKSNKIKQLNHYAEINKHAIDIFDKDKNHLLTIKMRKDEILFLDNSLDLMIKKERKVYRLYRISYLNSLKRKEKPQDDKALAYFDLALLGNINQQGIIRYHLLEQDVDHELLNLIGVAILVLIRK